VDEEHIPREQMRRVVAAADLAYDAARWAVGRPRSAEQGPPATPVPLTGAARA